MEAVRLVSDAAATLTAAQSAADGGPDGDDSSWQSPCSKNWKPYKTETKDIDTQASDAILALGVGNQAMA